MPTGLIRRGAAYSLRRRIPKDLLAHYGKAEIIRALGTKDRDEAKRLLALAWVELDQQFEMARQQLRKDPNEHLHEKLRQIAQANAGKPKSPPPTDADVEYDSWTSQQLFRDRFEEEVRYDLRELDRKKIFAVLDVHDDAVLSPEQLALRDILRDARDDIETAQQNAERAKRQAQPSTSAPSPQQPAFAPPSPNLKGSLIDLAERWAKERSPDDKTVRAHKAVAQWFTDRAGVASVHSVERSHVQMFKTALIDEGQSPANIKTKLSRLRTLLNFAVEEGTISSNPAKLVVAPPPKGGKARIAWPLKDLQKLFDGPVHSSGLRPVQGRGEAAFWMPLLGLFTGARREELGQLRGRDIIEAPYVTPSGETAAAWIIKIGHDEEGRNRLKTAASERIVPVHPELIGRGFIQYAQRRSADDLLFPFTMNKDGRLTEKWGEWFGRYRRDCGVSDQRVDFHSFRHSFKDYCRETGIIEGIQRQLMGHRPSDVADNYGSGFSTSALVNAMGIYRVPGLRLPPA